LKAEMKLSLSFAIGYESPFKARSLTMFTLSSSNRFEMTEFF
jgi:hypothetical protein